MTDTNTPLTLAMKLVPSHITFGGCVEDRIVTFGVDGSITFGERYVANADEAAQAFIASVLRQWPQLRAESARS